MATDGGEVRTAVAAAAELLRRARTDVEVRAVEDLRCEVRAAVAAAAQLGEVDS